ncbi:unknown [Clostridium sp. CAG:354]|nr:unknown [Clostridium sp. CAG:354]HIT23088.1 hypothetical protein [Candidatus Faecimonas intestinavium]
MLINAKNQIIVSNFNKIVDLNKKMLHIDIKDNDTFESIVKFQELQIKNLETKLEVYKK